MISHRLCLYLQGRDLPLLTRVIVTGLSIHEALLETLLSSLSIFQRCHGRFDRMILKLAYLWLLRAYVQLLPLLFPFTSGV
jgi:hypothetical protein